MAYTVSVIVIALGSLRKKFKFKRTRGWNQSEPFLPYALNLCQHYRETKATLLMHVIFL